MSFGLEQHKRIDIRHEIVQPSLQVFENNGTYTKQIRSTKDTLDLMFPEQLREEKDLLKVKAILGNLTASFTTQELKDIVTEVQYLADSWLDDFERSIFKGVTLQELLHEIGGR